MNTLPAAGLLLGIALFAFFGATNMPVPFDRDSLFVHVNILNQQDRDIDDASLTGYIYANSGASRPIGMDIDARTTSPGLLQFVIPAAPQQQPGYEPVRVVLRNDDVMAVKHVWVWMG
ncbi:TPA: hypothetical protein HA372_04520 [Candidatus Woesearchaeota archaeon]|nr:hypothetical protein [Candidatus Woesearchaeota archaeon]